MEKWLLWWQGPYPKWMNILQTISKLCFPCPYIQHNMCFSSNEKKFSENLFCVSSMQLITENTCSWYSPNCYCDRYIFSIYNQIISTLQNSNTFCYVLFTWVYAAFSSQEWFQFTHLNNSTCRWPRNVCGQRLAGRSKILKPFASFIQSHKFSFVDTHEEPISLFKDP